MPSPTQIVEFIYNNHQGKWAQRRVLPIRVWFGKTEWHLSEQWFLHAFDIDKLAPRDFAMVDITGWAPAEAAKPIEQASDHAAKCNGTYADEQGLSRPCTRMEGCGFRGCVFKP